MWSCGIYCLKLSERDFWRLTLAQFNALLSRYTYEQESLDYRAALICSILAEINRDRKKRKKPFTPTDFMPKRRDDEKLTDEQMLNRVKMISKALGAEVK